MADANKINGLFGKDINSVASIPSNTIYKVCNTVTKFDVLPAGLIIPLNDSVIPSGWQSFSSADGRLIMGAGGSYAPGATGGTNVGTNLGNLRLYLQQILNLLQYRSNFQMVFQPKLGLSLKCMVELMIEMY